MTGIIIPTYTYNYKWEQFILMLYIWQKLRLIKFSLMITQLVIAK